MGYHWKGLIMTSKEQAVRSAYCFNALQRFMTQAGSENAIVTVESKDGEKEDLLILKEIKEAIRMLHEKGD